VHRNVTTGTPVTGVASFGTCQKSKKRDEKGCNFGLTDDRSEYVPKQKTSKSAASGGFLRPKHQERVATVLGHSKLNGIARDGILT